MQNESLQNNEKLTATRHKKQAWRRQKNRLALLFSMLTIIFGLFWLIWILFTTLTKGIDGIAQVL